MDKKIEKSVKDALAVIGAVAVVKTAPILVTGVAIGALVTNPDKLKSAVEKVTTKLKEANEKLKESNENLEPDSEEDDDLGLNEFFEEEDRKEEAEEADITEQEVAKAFDEDVK